jgi:hypothetical protein
MCRFLALICVWCMALTAQASGVLNMLLGQGHIFQTSVTAGSNVVSGNGSIGYISGTIGSISSASIQGYTIQAVSDTYVMGSGTITTRISISGFSAEPAQGWFVSATFNGNTFTTATAASYTYSAGTATWDWASSTGFGFVNTDVYPGQFNF